MFKLFGVLEETDSDYNGKVRVIKDFQGLRIVAGGISQSGWIVKSIWSKSIKKISTIYPIRENILVLGLCGGSVVEVIVKYYPQAKITGVDIDAKMVELGKKYFHLDRFNNLGIFIKDAKTYLSGKNENKYDLILVDLFKGEDIPEYFRTRSFISLLKKRLSFDGAIIFNQLYSNKEKKTAEFFRKKLTNFFAKIVTIYPEANIMFLCFNNGNFAVKNNAKYNKRYQNI